MGAGERAVVDILPRLEEAVRRRLGNSPGTWRRVAQRKVVSEEQFRRYRGCRGQGGVGRGGVGLSAGAVAPMKRYVVSKERLRSRVGWAI